MPFVPGIYTLKASPVVGWGGTFATGNGLDKVVTVAAEVPSTFDGQIWDIKAVEGKEGVYTITHHPGKALEGSWSLKEFPLAAESFPQGPVILSEKAHAWYIHHDLSNEVFNAVTIQPVQTHPIAGSDFYVGTDENQVVIKAIEVTALPQQDVPYWQVERRF